jgi:hypothetical protein
MKTPGQIAYETDVDRCSLYQDGTPRKTWDQLADWMKDDWERHPEPRQYRKPIIVNV